MTPRDNDATKTHLARLGLNPVTVARLEGYAEGDGMSLAELVRYVLSDYAPPQESEPKADANP